MKKLLLILLISIGLIGIYSEYKLAEKKAAVTFPCDRSEQESENSFLFCQAVVDNNLEEAQRVYALFSGWREMNDALWELPYSAPSAMNGSLWLNVLEGKTFESYQQESAGLYCEPNAWSGKFDRDIAISAGKCQFGDYQIEFYQYWASAYGCYDQNSFCGVQPEDREVDPDWTVLVKDINGNVVATNIDISENAGV
ncbi:MAG: hypothetical protein NZ735_00780, partial [Candidatus Marinimicrobia bacterium]|nr:hypothetical protein [Candidatus Neomarinimicrobiota bacterium]